MYQVNTFIKHNRYGVCQIDEIMTRKMSNGEKKKYYVMHTLEGIATKISTPIESSDLEPVITKETLDELMDKIPSLPNIWVDDNRQRGEEFQKILNEGDVFELTSMIKTLYAKKAEKRKDNKSLQANDSKLLDLAESKLHDELGFCLSIKPEEVSAYIAKAVEGK